jgi:hypothetical protein
MYDIEGQYIFFSDGRKLEFPSTIVETIDFEDVIVVRVLSDSTRPIPLNIFGVSYRGKILWRIPQRALIPADSPFTGLFRNSSYVDAINWNGYSLTLHPFEGAVVSEGYQYMQVTTRRVASPRRWV